MTRKVCFVFIVLTWITNINAQQVSPKEGRTEQKIFTRNGKVTFVSDAPLEKIRATNTKGMSVIDLSSGKIEWAVLIRAFQFKKALMQEHFNENYMESSKYPKASFKGQILNIDNIDFSTPGDYDIDIKGMIIVRGIEKEFESDGKIHVSENGIKANSYFDLVLEDYGIEIPGVVKDNISKTVQVMVEADYQVMTPN